MDGTFKAEKNSSMLENPALISKVPMTAAMFMPRTELFAPVFV